MKLQGKIAIITGATSGIGEATAKLFAKEGGKVVIVGRNELKGMSILQAIQKEGGEADFVKTDVSKSLEVRNMVEETIRNYGQINILFNNAGVNPVGTVIDTSEEVWDYVMDVNLKGLFLCCKYVIPYMLREGGGVIINTGSICSFMAWENEVAYDTSKGGVLMFTKATAMDFAKKNIRVNCICPGAIKTPLLQKYFSELPNPKEIEKEMKEKHAMKRLGLPEEVAKLALFLASDDSSFITGAAYAIDGGILAGWS